MISRLRIATNRKLAIESLESKRLLSGEGSCLEIAADAMTNDALGGQLCMHHPPRLQLGNAPLKGYPGGESDQVDLLWQTVGLGLGSGQQSLDRFEVEYRRTDLADWNSAVISEVQDLDFQSRVNHRVEIRGLDFDAGYEYRVMHYRGDELLKTYQANFRTRLPAGDPQPFSFAAYGDSAYLPNVENFRQVQDQINQDDVDFAILLGDNVYNFGEPQEYDARQDPTISPEAVAWAAEHIDYFSVGNHDGSGLRWVNSSANYSVPVPEAGVTSPSAPSLWPQETAYSFDYGDAHFLTFNSNYYVRPEVLQEQMQWALDDLRASDAHWKIVFAHHPVSGAPDKDHDPQDDYFRQVVDMLNEAKVDLLLTGHSHVYSTTYPMLGEVEGQVVFVPDGDRHYDKGSGVVQVISGAGGKSLRPGTFSEFPFTASGYTTQTERRLEYGYAKVEVSSDQLVVSYIAADDGEVIDTITISEPAELSAIASVYLGSTSWSDEFKAHVQHPEAPWGCRISAGLGQSTPLPWSDVDLVSIQFADDFDPSSIDLNIRDLYSDERFPLVAEYHDASANVVTWQLAKPLEAGPIVLELTVANPTDTEPRTEWFPFAVLPGDVNGDGELSIADPVMLRNRIGTSEIRNPFATPIVSEFDVEQLIELVRPEPGDTNLDGRVDFEDFLQLAANFGTGSLWSEGDFDFDADVDFADFLALAAAWSAAE